MIIDIKRTVLKVQLRRFFTLLAVIVIEVGLLLLINSKFNWFGMNQYQWALVIAVIYALALVTESLLELNYIYFHIDARKIVLRYFSMSFFNRRKNAIEIPKEMFGGYEVKKLLWRRKTILILYEQINDKTAKYQPVSITALSKKEQAMLLKTLDKYKL